MDRLTVLVACLTLFGAATIVFAEGKQPMTVENLFAFKRVADPQVSPDGKLVAYVVDQRRPGRQQDLVGHLAGLDRKGRAAPADQRARQKGPPPALVARMARRSCSSRTARANRSSGSSTSSGGEAKQLTTISTGADNAIWSPDGKHDRLRLGRLPGVLREAVQGERRRQQEDARRRSRRTRSRPRCSRSSSTATGTPTSRTSGNTCSSCPRTAANRRT